MSLKEDLTSLVEAVVAQSDSLRQTSAIDRHYQLLQLSFFKNKNFRGRFLRGYRAIFKEISDGHRRDGGV